METSAISADVKSFVETHIQSLWQLDLLAWLHNHSTRAWTAEELATKLSLDSSAVESGLERLSSCGVTRIDGGYSLSPATQELSSIIDQVVQLYAQRRLSMVNLIYGKG